MTNNYHNNSNNRIPTMSSGSRRRMASAHANAHVHVTPTSFQGLDWFSSSYKSTSLSWNKKSTAKSNNGGYNFVVSQLPLRRETTLEFNGSDFQLDYKEESIHMFLSKVLEDIATSYSKDDDNDNDKPLTKHLRLRNLTLSSHSQQQLIQVLSTINNGHGLESLTLSNVSSSSCSSKSSSTSSSMDVVDWASERPSSSPSSSSSSSSSETLHKEVLNCDFLLASQVKLDNLTIERCRLNTESSNTLGRAVAECQVQNFKVNNVSFVSSSSSSSTTNTTTEASKNTCGSELTGRLLGEGLGLAQSTLKILEIRQVTCDDSRKLFSNLLRGLRSCTMLEKLHLEGCGLGSSEADTSVDHDENGEYENENENRNDDVRQLTYLVTSLQKLNTLNLYQNNINGSGLEVLLSRGMSGHPSLNRLVLSQNPIGDDGAKHLASFFSAKSKSATNTKISSLSISDCDIWSPGCIELIKCLAVNSTIEDLNVDDEWESHCKELETALDTNMTLKYLSTPQSSTQNRTIDDEWKKVEYYLRLNRAKRRILVAEPRVPRSLWPLVMGQSSKDPDVAYHLIRQRPEIIE